MYLLYEKLFYFVMMLITKLSDAFEFVMLYHVFLAIFIF